MNFTKIEELAQNNDLTIEVEIKKSGSTAYIYKEGDLKIYSFKDEFLNIAINKAVENYFNTRRTDATNN